MKLEYTYKKNKKDFIDKLDILIGYYQHISSNYLQGVLTLISFIIPIFLSYLAYTVSQLKTSLNNILQDVTNLFLTIPLSLLAKIISITIVFLILIILLGLPLWGWWLLLTRYKLIEKMLNKTVNLDKIAKAQEVLKELTKARLYCEQYRLKLNKADPLKEPIITKIEK